MSDDVIPLNEIGKIGTVKVYTQAYVDKLQSKLTKATEIIKTLLSSKTDFDERRFALWVWKEEVNKAEQFINEVEN